MPLDIERPSNFAAMLGLAWLIVAAALLLVYWPSTAETLLDTDDAMRLTQLRAWLEGRGLLSGWYDMRQPRLQPPEGIDMHWSRLVDLGLAIVLAFFRLFVDAADAERLMRAWWPLLWLIPTMAGMSAVAWRIAGREAATVALLFAMVGVPAYQQFMPGRIDHHNVMIALTLLALAATVWSDRKSWAGYAAGALSGTALAIGFECLPYVGACGATLALRYVVDRDHGAVLARYGAALAVSAAAGFAISVGPSHWKSTWCDAIAINNAAAMVCAGMLLMLVGRLRHPHRVTRLAAVIGAGAASAAVLLLIEPKCARGPMAMIDPAIWPIWLGHVREMQPLLSALRINSLSGVAIAAFPVAGLVAVIVLLREGHMRRDFAFLTAALAFVAAAATTVLAIRAYSYAMWLGMPLVAVLALRLFAVFRIRRFIPRLAVALALTPMALSSAAIAVAAAAGLADRDNFSRPAMRACFASASYAPLRLLDPGLIAADVSFGPYILALTPHSVLAAPYHRLSKGIVNAHRVLAGPPAEARAAVLEAGVKYVAVCGPRPPDGVPEQARVQGLWAKLQSGAVPDWLKPVLNGPAFVVYFVVRP
jgi:hypothetical protein